MEKIWSPKTHSSRLIAESFTKGVFTVPGYTANEKDDVTSSASSDPPFDPSPGKKNQLKNLIFGKMCNKHVIYRMWGQIF